MRGRLYYTAKAKKNGKVMIKIHPCSHLCFCKCWTCFKEVPGPGIRGHSRGGAGALGLQLCPGLWTLGPHSDLLWCCGTQLLPSFPSSSLLPPC